jgi:hypothetical protein
MGARTGRPRGFMLDPAKRHERAVKAGKASGEAARRRAVRRAQGMSPAEAFLAGDKVGYARAYHYWHRWAKRTVEQVAQQRQQEAA